MLSDEDEGLKKVSDMPRPDHGSVLGQTPKEHIEGLPDITRQDGREIAKVSANLLCFRL